MNIRKGRTELARAFARPTELLSPSTRRSAILLRSSTTLGVEWVVWVSRALRRGKSGNNIFEQLEAAWQL